MIFHYWVLDMEGNELNFSSLDKYDLYTIYRNEDGEIFWIIDYAVEG